MFMTGTRDGDCCLFKWSFLVLLSLRLEGVTSRDLGFIDSWLGPIGDGVIRVLGAMVRW